MTLSPSSLRNKLLWTAAALVLVPGLLIGWLADRSARASLQTVIGRQLAREASHTAERISALLDAERRTLESFARQDWMRELRVADLDKRIAQALTTLRSGRPERLDYVALDTSQEVVAASHATLLGPAPDWVQRALTATSPVPERLGAGPQHALAIRAAVPDPDGGTSLGWLVGRLDWRLVEGVAQELRRDLADRGIEAQVVVVDATGRALAAADSPELSDPARLGSADGWWVDREAEAIAGWAALPGHPSAWRLLVVERLDHAMAPARELTRTLALTIGLALAAALCVGAIGSERVIRPLSELTRAIREMPRTRPAPVPVRSRDEVGALAAAFNTMAGDLDRTQQELVEAEKFAFVGQLASGVAHEVRTSLGVLRSAAQIVERSLPESGDPRIPELAQMMRAEVDRLGGIVNDLLTLDRPRALRRERLRLSDPAGRALAFVAPRAEERGVALERVEDGDPFLDADPEALQQVLVNLLVNAIRSLESGGRVELGWSGEDEVARLRVRDDGPGIDPALRERIFDPFVTGSEGGVGLGLTFVKRVVGEHGGRVELVEGLPRADGGHGAGFQIELPVAKPAGDPK